MIGIISMNTKRAFYLDIYGRNEDLYCINRRENRKGHVIVEISFILEKIRI